MSVLVPGARQPLVAVFKGGGRVASALVSALGGGRWWLAAALVSLLLVVACGGGGGGASSGGQVGDGTLGGPANVLVQAGDQSVTLTWDPVVGADSYNVYRATQAGVSKSTYDSLPGGTKLSGQTSPVAIGSLSNGTTYYFIVTSVRNSPAFESDGSAEVSATPASAPPGAPQNISAQAGNQRATLSWDPVSGADSYVIYLASQSGVTKDNYGTLPGGRRVSGQTSPALVTSLSNGTPYYFVVTSVRNSPAYESAISSEANATPVALPGDTEPITGAAISVTSSTASLGGSFTNPSGYTTTAWFDYGTTTAYGSSSASEAYLAAATINFSKDLTGLPERTPIHYRLVTQNSGGTFLGQDKTFTTLATPVALLSDLDAPVGPVFDGTSLYWMEIYSGRVRRLNVNTGTASTLSTTVFGGNSGAIAIDASHVYFVDDGSTIRRMDHDGGNRDDAFSTVAKSPSQIVVHSTGIYVREEEWAGSPSVPRYYLSRISLDGATRTQLYDRPGSYGGIAVDGAFLYWANYGEGTIQRLALSGGSPVIVANGMDRPDQLLLDGLDLYVTHHGGIGRINLGTGTMTPVFYPGTSSYSWNMVKAGGVIYATHRIDNYTNEVVRIELDTGVATRLAIETAPYGHPSVPVATSTHLYWITAGNHYNPPLGTLKRIAIP